MRPKQDMDEPDGSARTPPSAGAAAGRKPGNGRPRHRIRPCFQGATRAVQRGSRPENPKVTVPMQRMLQAAENRNSARGSPRSIIIP